MTRNSFLRFDFDEYEEDVEKVTDIRQRLAQPMTSSTTADLFPISPACRALVHRDHSVLSAPSSVSHIVKFLVPNQSIIT